MSLPDTKSKVERCPGISGADTLKRWLVENVHGLKKLLIYCERFLRIIGFNLDSDEDIRLSESGCEESEEKQIKLILVRLLIYDPLLRRFSLEGRGLQPVVFSRAP
ncbi:hypothetical protein TNCV_1929621 [Trichonephila clavipes]|nr:hypothetical protein TNCV_1929621 [Trichonephila clavipes]